MIIVLQFLVKIGKFTKVCQNGKCATFSTDFYWFLPTFIVFTSIKLGFYILAYEKLVKIYVFTSVKNWFRGHKIDLKKL